MKNNVVTMLLAVGAACVCGSALNAQTYTLSAKVPFSFQAADKAFPAGNYRLGEYGAIGIPSLQNAKTGDSAFIAGASHSLSQAGSGKLVFHCYGPDSCFLAEIWPTTGNGSVFAKTKAEKEIHKGEQPREMATIAIDLRRAD